MGMRRLLGISLLLVFSAGVSAGTITLGPRHKDESNGFRIQLPRKWEQVPTKFQDVVTVGKWSARRAKRGYYVAHVRVLRFMKLPAEEAPKSPREALRRGIPGYGGMLRFQPKSVWEYVERNYGKMVVVEDEPEFRMSSKKFTAHLRVLKQDLGGRSGKQIEKQQALIVAAEISTVEASTSSYGVVYIATVADT